MLSTHPEWTQPELAAWIGRSLGWIKKWVKRLREAPVGDIRVLFGLPRGRRTPYPPLDPLLEERILAIRDEPPENLRRVPGPKAIQYYLARDPDVQQSGLWLPWSTRTIWKVLRSHGRIARPLRLPHQPLERPAPMSAWQIDFKDASTVPAKVERYHRTLKYECLLVVHPQTPAQVRQVTAAFVAHYNFERPNQARSCGNQPPRVAFADLPRLAPLPDVVDPDRWLWAVDGQHFVRKVRHNGSVILETESYDIKASLAGQYVDVCLDAATQELVIWHRHQPVKRVAIKGLAKTALSFEQFARLMSQQALAEQRRQAQAHRRRE